MRIKTVTLWNERKYWPNSIFQKVYDWRINYFTPYNNKVIIWVLYLRLKTLQFFSKFFFIIITDDLHLYISFICHRVIDDNYREQKMKCNLAPSHYHLFLYMGRRFQTFFFTLSWAEKLSFVSLFSTCLSGFYVMGAWLCKGVWEKLYFFFPLETFK